MLPKAYRLPGKDFKKITSSGRHIPGQLFGAVILKSSKAEPSRFGFIVSAKVAKKAVDRNRIKRLLREAVRVHLSHSSSGYDAILLAKRSLKDVSLKEVSAAVGDLFKRLN